MMRTMSDMYNTLKIGINDLRHKRCGTPLILKYTDDGVGTSTMTIKPYCPKCKRFMKSHNVIEVNPGLETQRKLIIMIETMSRVGFRVDMNRGKLRGLQRIQ